MRGAAAPACTHAGPSRRSGSVYKVNVFIGFCNFPPPFAAHTAHTRCRPRRCTASRLQHGRLGLVCERRVAVAACELLAHTYGYFAAVGRRCREACAPIYLKGPARSEVYLLAREALHLDMRTADLFGADRAAEDQRLRVLRRKRHEGLAGIHHGVGVEHGRDLVGILGIGPEGRHAVGLGIACGDAERLAPLVVGIGAEPRTVKEEYAAYVLDGLRRRGRRVDPLLEGAAPLPLRHAAPHRRGQAVVEAVGRGVYQIERRLDDLGGVHNAEMLAVERGLDHERHVEPLALLERVYHLRHGVLFEMAVIGYAERITRRRDIHHLYRTYVGITAHTDGIAVLDNTFGRAEIVGHTVALLPIGSYLYRRVGHDLRMRRRERPDGENRETDAEFHNRMFFGSYAGAPRHIPQSGNRHSDRPERASRSGPRPNASRTIQIY